MGLIAGKEGGVEEETEEEEKKGRMDCGDFGVLIGNGLMKGGKKREKKEEGVFWG